MSRERSERNPPLDGTAATDDDATTLPRDTQHIPARPTTPRLIAKAFAAPLALVPTLLGGLTTLAAAAVAAGGANGAGFLAFLGVSGLVLGVGSGVTRLLLGTEKLATEAMLEDEDKMRQRADERLSAADSARKQASRSRDAEAAERAARLGRAWERASTLPVGVDERLPVVLGDKIEQLWDSCLGGVRRLVRLGEVGRDLATSDARQRLDAQRTTLRGELDVALDRLDAAIDRLQLEAVSQDTGGRALSDMSDELDRGLEVARQVERRMQSLDSELSPLRDH